MPRLAIGALAGLPFLLLSVALVQWEGRAYRRALAERPRPAVADGPEPAEPSPPPSHAVAAVTPDPRPEPTRPATPEPSPPAPRPGVPFFLAAPPRPIAAETPADPPFPDPVPARDPTTLTTREEAEIGRMLHDAIGERHPFRRDQDQARALREAARPLLALRQRPDVDYEFTVLDSDEVNAFSHPGGYVYVSRGLFDLIADEAELQFVLAHEIAHVEDRHAAEQVARSLRQARAAGREPPGLLFALYRQIALGYDDAQEYAADGRAFALLLRAGLSRHDILRFPRHLLEYADHRGLAWHSRPESAPDDPFQDLANHLRSHPPADLRLDRLRALPAQN